MANQYQPLVDAMEHGVKDVLNQLIDGTIEDDADDTSAEDED